MNAFAKIKKSRIDREKFSKDLSDVMNNIVVDLQSSSSDSFYVDFFVPDKNVCCLTHSLAYSNIFDLDSVPETYIFKDVKKKNLFGREFIRNELIFSVKNDLYINDTDLELRARVFDIFALPAIYSNFWSFKKEYGVDLNIVNFK
ncbi:hypothetical protein KO361_06230 [Candidatus Woesearchaeota archaeon]|nr:hypothetical protein [Candidatus Woesearchaeota archaeon]